MLSTLRAAGRPQPAAHDGSSNSCSRPRPRRSTLRRRLSSTSAAAPAASSTATPAVDPSFGPLAQWIEAAGGSVRGVSLQPCRMGPALVRGLTATAAAPAGEALLSVPLSRALRDTGVAPAYANAPWSASMAAHLLSEAAKGSGSDWAPYIASLPGGALLAGPEDAAACAEAAGTLALSAEGVAALQYSPAVAALQVYQKQSREAYAAWRAAGSSVAASCGWERFALALHLVQSRTIRLAVMGCRAMIPAIDCLNHGGSAGATGTLALGSSAWAVEGERTVTYVTTRAVEAGEQVLWTYGDRSSEDFLVYHGFTLPGNTREEVVLWGSVAELAAWAAAQLSGGSGSSGDAAATIAEAAAQRAAGIAGIACPSPRVPGTCSWLLAPLELEGVTQEASPSAVPTAGSTRGRQSSSSSGSSGGGEGALEGWLRALKRAGPAVERRLASLRLHLAEWGTVACPATPPELSASGDGRCDVRATAALIAAAEAAAAGAPPLAAAAVVSEARKMVRARASELLAAFPTSAADDEALLASGAAGGGLAYEAVAYRLAKKRVLQQLLAGG